MKDEQAGRGDRRSMVEKLAGRLKIQRLRPWLCAVIACLLTVGANGERAVAWQIFPQRADGKSADPSDSFPVDPKLSRQLLNAQEELDEKNYQVALRRLGLILGAEKAADEIRNPTQGSDFFFTQTPTDAKSFGSLKGEALAMIAALPAEGRRVYEDLYGHVAKSNLDAAVAAGDINGIAEVSRRFFHTSAGYEAAYLLSTHHMDHSRPFYAARGFERLRQQPSALSRWEPLLSLKTAICWARVGHPEKSADVMAVLRRNYPQTEFSVGGVPVRLFDGTEAGSAMISRIFAQPSLPPVSPPEQWVMQGGNPARNAFTTDSFPLLKPKWQAPLIHNKGMRDVARGWQEIIEQSGDLSISAVTPLVVGDRLIVKTISDEAVPTGAAIYAYDLPSGEMIWRTTPDFGFDPMPPHPLTPTLSGSQAGEHFVRDTLSKQRIWHDHTFGSLSSDGQSVFSVEELESFRPARRVRAAPLRPFNVLRAYAAQGGKARWEIGGSPKGASLPLAGTFFLGPPLPLEGNLYCLCEQDRQVRLLVLDADSGALLWSISLFVVNSQQNALAINFRRRMTGISPAFSQGVLVCPTGAGSVVAVDVENRSLLWHDAYRDDRGSPRRFDPFMDAPQTLRQLPGLDEERWLTSTPIISSNGSFRVVVTPSDSPELFCFDLLTGKRLWRKSKLDWIQVVGIHGRGVVVLGREKIEVFDIQDGSSLLPEPISIPHPSGQGILAGEKLLVPLSTAELLAFDLKTGQISRRASSADGRVPGNLLVHKQTVISVGTDSISAFDDLELAFAQVEKRLESDPEDREALIARAEIHTQNGDLLAAANDLERLWERHQDPSTRKRLLDVLLAGLGRDFDAFRDRTTEIELLIDSPQQKMDEILKNARLSFAFYHDQLAQLPNLLGDLDDEAAYLRNLAQGLARAEDAAPALDAMQRFTAGDGARAIDEVDSVRAIRRDRWSGAQLNEMLRDLPPDQLEIVRQHVQTERTAALNVGSSETLRRFLMRFGGASASTQVLKAMPDAVPGGIELVESELALLRLLASGDEELAAFATEKLARMMIEAERPAVAVGYVELLHDRWADVPILDGKTGRELADAWRADPEFERVFAGESSWPMGPVEVIQEPRSGQNPLAIMPIGIDEDRSSSQRSLALFWDSNTRELIAQGTGSEEIWRYRLPNQNRFSAGAGLSARIMGDLVMLQHGAEIFALDTLGLNGQHKARKLWSYQFRDPYQTLMEGGQRFRSLRSDRQNRPLDMRGRVLGGLGPVTFDAVYYQEGRTIVAAEPLTGERLWQRSDVEHGSLMFVDEDRLMVVAPSGRTASFYRRDDGQYLGERPFLNGLQYIKTYDGHLLGFQYTDHHFSLESRHIWTGKTVWSKAFQKSSLWTRVGNDELAVLQRNDGRFFIVNGHDGSSSIDTEVKAQPQAIAINVQSSIDRHVLIVNHPTQTQAMRVHSGRRGSVNVHGTIHGIDRHTGVVRWSTEVSNQTVDLNQPAEIPILVLSSLISKRSRPGTQRPSLELLCLDKRTGKIIFEPKSGLEGGIWGYHAAPEQNTVRIDLQRSSILLTFTAPPAESSPEQPDSPE